MTGNCNGLFQFGSDERKKNPHPLHVFTHNMMFMLTGQFNNGSDTEITAVDAILENVQFMHVCAMSLQIKESGPPFTYNLDTMERTYTFTKTDLCYKAGPASNGSVASGQENTAASIREYFADMEPVSLGSDTFNKKGARRLLSHLEEMEGQGEKYEVTLNLFETTSLEFSYFGEKNADGQFHGAGVFKIDDKQSCYRGVCKAQEYGKLSAWFEDGVPQGLVLLTSTDNYQITYINVRDGIVHSIVITTGLRPSYKNNIPKVPRTLNPQVQMLRQNGVARLAKFVNGKIEGPVWSGLLGFPAFTQGFIYGFRDKKTGEMTGDDIAYIYPGGRVALKGRFEDRYMKAARETDITRAICKDNLLTLEFGEQRGPTFYYDLPSNFSLGSMPLVRDPYELQTVELWPSTVPGAGHGIFAKRNLTAGEVVAFYNGMQYMDEQTHIHEAECQNRNGGVGNMEARRRCHKYHINNYNGALVNIPPEWDDVRLYNASLAQKVNNKFEPFINAHFGHMDHPRFGAIPTVWLGKNVTAGEEVFLDYGYGPGAEPLVPWFFKQLNATREYLELMKKGEDVSHLPVP